MKNTNSKQADLETRMLNNKKGLIVLLTLASIFIPIYFIATPWLLVSEVGLIGFATAAGLMSIAMRLNKVPTVYIVAGLITVMGFGTLELGNIQSFLAIGAEEFYKTQHENFQSYLQLCALYFIFNAVRGLWLLVNLIPQLQTDTKEVDIWHIGVEM